MTGAERQAIGERATKQKKALAGLLDAEGTFRSAQDLFILLQQDGYRVGLSTVYTQLRALAESGEIDAIQNDHGETLYRRCDSRSHHHHLVCRSCGAAVEIALGELEQQAKRIAQEAGFRDVTHTIEIQGVCPACQSGNSANR